MKYISKALLLLVATLTFENAFASKAASVPSGTLSVVGFKEVLRNRQTIRRGFWDTLSTGERIYFFANMRNYLPQVTDDQIDGIIELPSSQVKSGKYRNNYYNANGSKVPMQQEYLEIIPGYSYFCTPDGVALAKTNCLNEQDYLAPYVAPKPAPAPVSQNQWIKDCDGVNREMLPKKRPESDGRWSADGMYRLRNDGTWFTSSDGVAFSQNLKELCPVVQHPSVRSLVTEMTCDPNVGPVIKEDYLGSAGEEIYNSGMYIKKFGVWYKLNATTGYYEDLCNYNIASTTPKKEETTMSRKYESTAQNTGYVYQQRSTALQFFLNISSGPAGQIIREFIPYYPPQPQPQFTGTPSNGGSQGSGGIPSNGGSGGVSTGGTSSNGGSAGNGGSGSNGGGGYIPGVNQRIGRR